jgi:hypothetical protein
MPLIRRTVAFVAVASLLTLVSSGVADASFQGFNGRLAFSSWPASCVSNCGRFVRLFTVKPDGSGLTQIASTTPMTVPALLSDDGPRWSPDGARIAFTRSTLDLTGSIVSSDVYTVPANGGHLTHVTSGFEPTWLPDGRLAVRDAQTGTVSIMNADGTNRTTFLPFFNGSSLAWSPEGALIAFERFGDIWLMHTDGSAQTPLTSTPSLGDSAPNWAPQGGRLVFGCQIPLFLNICAINTDGSGFASLTSSHEPEGSSGPVFSPDGRRIAFGRRSAGPDSAFTLWTMARDGSDQHQLLDQRVGVIDWQPVHATFGPFQPPVNPDGFNRVTAGRTIPIKFTLGQDFGPDIFADGYPLSTAIPCGVASGKTIVDGGDAASRLDHDAAGGYLYLWKTDRSWAGTCRTLTIKLRDGSERSARFSFR